jgi:small subunit ribosomal protein S1
MTDPGKFEPNAIDLNDAGAGSRPDPGPNPNLHEAVEADQTYEDLIESYSQSAPSHNERMHGRVVGVTPTQIIVDFGYKLEGVVPLQDLKGGQVRGDRLQADEEDGAPFKVGDAIDVKLDRYAAKQEGYIPLSWLKPAPGTEKVAELTAEQSKVWDGLELAHREQSVITGKVTERTKGGLLVDVGGFDVSLSAFLPGSQVDTRPLHDLDQFIGLEIPVKLVTVNRQRRNIVVSRKLAVEGELKARKQATLERLDEGAVLTGTVKNLTEYGAFVDLGGIDGLLHVSDLSHGRVNHPAEIVQPGQEVTVKVLKFDREKDRVSLGIRQLTPDPWVNLPERLLAGSHVLGRVTSVTDYGCFVEIEPGVEGLIHISEMTWSRRMKHPGKIMKVGDPVEAVVLEVKPRERRVSLGIKQLEADPWTTVAQRYSVGSVVEGRVRKLADFGAFLEIEDGIDGLVHVSDLSWTQHVKHASEVLKKGQMMQTVILSIDAPNRRLSLGIKQLQPDAWELFFRDHAVGDVVRGKVCRVAAFGVFVELAPGVEGLCHKSEIQLENKSARNTARPSERKPADPRQDWALPVGQDYDFKVIRIEEAEKRVGLSLRGAAEREEDTRLQGYHRQAAAATVTMEQAMNQQGVPGRNENER